ncbi:piggyBac transposable element-derived protein 3-like [Episyrphus balteatus]|uniref:piggyBac transposable element-derived protein 3-like n=1 Tax=Episyrphus balteatus TaxID=286459 RepID=UPI002485D220|nr:piggyBac transposable element-derived protein 3-like [Episyrphus balteatus]
MYRKKFLSAKELEELLMNPSSDEDEELNLNLDAALHTNIIILPPKNDAVSDNEDIDDNEQLLEDRNEFPNELAGEVELECMFDDLNSQNPEINEPEVHVSPNKPNSASTSQNVASTSKKELACLPYKLPKWSKSHRVEFSKKPTDVSSENIRTIYDKIGNFNPLEMLELFLDSDIINFIVDHTNAYANIDKNNPTFKTDGNEIRKFIGIMYFSGLHTVPQLDLYWSNQQVFGCDLIKNTMSRDRFRKIKCYLHVCDNSKIDPRDKFAKVSLLNNMLNERFMQFGVFCHHLSIDEQMIPYYGRHSAKMFIRGKPIRFGYKYWNLCSHDGYLFQFIPYGGASTVRENRTGKAVLTDPKQMKKKSRGSMDFAFDKENEIAAVRWNDNSIVTVLSNHLMDQPINQAKRFDRKQRKHINIPMPNAIRQYNVTMGGVDLFDNATSNYRIRIRGKKWYWPLLTNALDAALVNAWKMHCICKKFAKETSMSQLEFRTFVVDALLRSETNSEPVCQTEGSPNVVVRFDSMKHTVIKTEKRLRCRKCSSQTIFSCRKCNIPLHPKCFEEYHTKALSL